MAPSGQVYTPKGLKDYEVPHALTESEIAQVIEQYRQVAISLLLLAMSADGMTAALAHFLVAMYPQCSCEEVLQARAASSELDQKEIS